VSDPDQHAGESRRARAPNPVVRGLAVFGHFWWDFLVGDTPELFVATLVVIGLAVVLHRQRVVSILVLLAAVLIVLGLSIWRGRKQLK
jgi:hypothetical protein